MLAQKPTTATWLKLGRQIPIFLLVGWCEASDTPVNSTLLQDQERPSVAQLNDGTLVFVWEDESVSNGRIMLRRFNLDLSPIGGEQQVSIANNAARSEPVVAALSDGGYVVAYSAGNLDADLYGVGFRRYNANGVPLDGTEVLANTLTATAQFRPQVAPLPGGGFVLTWIGQGGALGQDIFYRRFGGNGVPLDAGDVRANNLGNDAVTAGDQGNQKVATLDDGSFVIVYEDRASGDVYGVRINSNGAAFDAVGEPSGNKQFRLNLSTPFEQTLPCVAALADGGFVVTYNTETNGTAQSRRVLSRIYNENGVGGPELLIGNHAKRWQDGRVAGLSGGDFVAVWQGLGEAEDAGTNTWSLWTQRFSLTGEARIAPFRVNTQNASDQDQAWLAPYRHAGFVIAWQSFGQDSSRDGVFARSVLPAPGKLSLVRSSAGNAIVSGLGDAGWIHELQRSSDLSLWTSVMTTNPATGSFQFTEPVGNVNHFFRMQSF